MLCIIRDFGLLFLGKKSLIAGCGFLVLFKKYGRLLGNSDKQLCFFIYVCRILQCID